MHRAAYPGFRFTTVLPALLLLGAVGLGQQAVPAVTLKTVKYDELTDTVRSLKGKVVLVDFWEDT